MEQYDYDNDEKWKEYFRNVTLPESLKGEEKEKAVRKLKYKWYKRIFGEKKSGNEIIVEHFAVGPLQCNCTIIVDTDSSKCIVVDPGGDAENILERVRAHNAQLCAILVTHAHIDHILAMGELKSAYRNATIYMHREDQALLLAAPMQCMMIGVAAPSTALPPIDTFVEHEQQLSLCDGNVLVRVLHTPGHTLGSCCFHVPSQRVLLSGDTLFNAGVGRTDLPGGNTESLHSSILTRLYTLEESTRVIPGHGAETTIGAERRSNPFVRAKV